MLINVHQQSCHRRVKLSLTSFHRKRGDDRDVFDAQQVPPPGSPDVVEATLLVESPVEELLVELSAVEVIWDGGRGVGTSRFFREQPI